MRAIPFNRAKNGLATLWFTGGAIIIVLMFLQTVFGKFEDQSNDAWSWILSNLMPSLSLILSTFLSDINATKRNTRRVDSFYYYLALGISIFYLLLLLMLIALEPLTDHTILELMHDSGIYLGPLQGLATAAMGMFFFKKTEEENG